MLPLTGTTWLICVSDRVSESVNSNKPEEGRWGGGELSCNDASRPQRSGAPISRRFNEKNKKVDNMLIALLQGLLASIRSLKLSVNT